MKGLIFSSLAGLIIASIGCSYASDIRISAINESSGRANLILPSNGKIKVIKLGSADATLMTANYSYPSPILIQTANQFPKPCNWTDPPAGKQIARLRSIDLTISPNPDNPRRPICLLSWH